MVIFPEEAEPAEGNGALTLFLPGGTDLPADLAGGLSRIGSRADGRNHGDPMSTGVQNVSGIPRMDAADGHQPMA